jgi:hypothetical protein
LPWKDPKVGAIRNVHQEFRGLCPEPEVGGDRLRTSITLITWGNHSWGNHMRQLVKTFESVETSRGFHPPIFVDIRIQRSGRAPGFIGAAFEKLLGPDHHHWMKSLGNLKVKTRTRPGIQIAEPAAAEELLDLALESARNKQRLLCFCSCLWPRWNGKMAAIGRRSPGWC